MSPVLHITNGFPLSETAGHLFSFAQKMKQSKYIEREIHETIKQVIVKIE